MARAYRSYASTGQQKPIRGREHEMVLNNAGGYSFILGDWERLHRFLTLGSEGGTYYVGEAKLTVENAQCVLRCLKEDGPRTVQQAHAINVHNRAPKVGSQLFTMALALHYGTPEAKQAAEALLPSMLRTGTHLLNFAGMLDNIGGWNRTKRRIISTWFQTRDLESTAFQVLKYQNRDGWRMRDAMRLAHPHPHDDTRNALFAWVCDKAHKYPTGLPPLLARHYNMLEQIEAGADPIMEALKGISYGLPREALPTETLTNREVMTRLVPQMGLTALIRNLGNLTRQNIFDNKELLTLAVSKITDPAQLKRGRIHPFTVMLALLIYREGVGIRGVGWKPLPDILQALETALELSYGNVVPTNRKLCIGVDISGSMNQSCVGSPISADLAAAAVATVLCRVEPHATLVYFDTVVQKVMKVSANATVSSLHGGHRGGGTDVAAPLNWALGRDRRGHRVGAVEEDFDAFLILTDNETWAGHVHPTDALKQYRRERNPNAKLICASMAANHATVVDGADPLQLGICGLDSNLPVLVHEFLGGVELPQLEYEMEGADD
jgi:60 kDa SS-A/Ro ribonucleoprotein